MLTLLVKRSSSVVHWEHEIVSDDVVRDVIPPEQPSVDTPIEFQAILPCCTEDPTSGSTSIKRYCVQPSLRVMTLLITTSCIKYSLVPAYGMMREMWHFGLIS